MNFNDALLKMESFYKDYFATFIGAIVIVQGKIGWILGADRVNWSVFEVLGLIDWF